MSEQQSISQWIANLKFGDADAAQKLWDRYSERLIHLAKLKLDNLPKQVTDEEDIAQSVFRSVCNGAAAGRLNDIKSRDELWWLLISITKQKVVDSIRRETAQKRGGGRVQNEASIRQRNDSDNIFSLDYLIGDEPTPEFIVAMEEENLRLLSLLRDDQLRSIAMRRMEGYSVSEIADELAVSTRSVERKLQLIRTTWSEECLSAS